MLHAAAGPRGAAGTTAGAAGTRTCATAATGARTCASAAAGACAGSAAAAATRSGAGSSTATATATATAAAAAAAAAGAGSGAPTAAGLLTTAATATLARSTAFRCHDACSFSACCRRRVEAGQGTSLAVPVILPHTRVRRARAATDGPVALAGRGVPRILVVIRGEWRAASRTVAPDRDMPRHRSDAPTGVSYVNCSDPVPAPTQASARNAAYRRVAV
jgi:hypothetical protein